MLNKVIHEPARLRIMATLKSLPVDEQIDFKSLAKMLELTDGNLGSHLQKLEDAGFIEIEKSFVDRKPRTHVAINQAGREAFSAHVAALESILFNEDQK